MSIFATDTPMHPDDREAWWVSMKRAYLNNERAVNHFAVVAVTKINLATKTRQGDKPFMTAARPSVARKRGTDFV